ncbi:MFS transporter [Serratia marcescens]|uniref:MFS transporter n=1 Tax=Serratia marcescens TaxID=615 RepID=UPI000CDD100A|nr:MFS transporter [Serratia marcescens]POW98548.1 MFS transporter [Serratia marcescens]POX02459.1 MFS transporter [Serratia marcescens]POX16683.1 MFS transporter [Serratia marcescens]RTF43678.1 MFS transporter [Serratia marcescens]
MNDAHALEKKVIWLMALIQFINAVDFMIVMPLGADFASALHMSAANIGYLGGGYTLAAAVSSLLVAKYIDRFDRKRVVLVMLFGLSVATLMCAHAWNMKSLMFTRIVAGAFAGPLVAISLAILTDCVPVERRGRAMAIVMGAFSIAAIAGVPLGLKLASWYQWSMPFYVVGASGMLVTALVVVLLPGLKGHLQGTTSRPPDVSLVALMANRRVLLAISSLGLAVLSTFLLLPNLAVWLQLNAGVARDDLSMYYLIGGGVSVIVLQIFGRVIDKMGALSVVMGLAAGIFVVIFDGFMHASFLPPLVIFTAFMALTATRTIAATTVNTTVPAPNVRAAFMSLQSICQHVFSGLAAILSSCILVEEQQQLHNLEILAACALALTLVQPLVLQRLLKHQ